jgi:hypothetical protein
LCPRAGSFLSARISAGNPMRPRPRTNGTVISPAAGDAGMSSRLAVAALQTPSRHDVLFRPYLSECVSDPAQLPESRTSSGVLPRSESLTRMARSLVARSFGFTGEFRSLKQCSSNTAWGKFTIPTRMLSGETIGQRGCNGPRRQLAPVVGIGQRLPIQSATHPFSFPGHGGAGSRCQDIS